MLQVVLLFDPIEITRLFEHALDELRGRHLCAFGLQVFHKLAEVVQRPTEFFTGKKLA